MAAEDKLHSIRVFKGDDQKAENFVKTIECPLIPVVGDFLRLSGESESGDLEVTKRIWVSAAGPDEPFAGYNLIVKERSAPWVATRSRNK